MFADSFMIRKMLITVSVLFIQRYLIENSQETEMTPKIGSLQNWVIPYFTVIRQGIHL